VRAWTHTGQFDDLHPGQRTSGHSSRTVYHSISLTAI
jgi:hypothetical protein